MRLSQGSHLEFGRKGVRNENFAVEGVENFDLFDQDEIQDPRGVGDDDHHLGRILSSR
jgi:hypothetical protein